MLKNSRFDSMENAFLKEFWFPAPENKYKFCDYNGLNPLNNFRNILTNAHKNSTEVVLFISAISCKTVSVFIK